MIRGLVILLMFIITTGCSVDREVLDDIHIATLIGYDTVDGKIKATAVVPIFQPDGTIKNEFFTEEGHSNKDIGKKIMFQSEKPIVNGKVETVVFDTKFAEKGFIESTDVYRRDPSVSSNIKLAIYDGEVNELLSIAKPETEDLGIYVSKLIEQNITSETIPRTNIHLFFQSYYTEGEDPFLPLLYIKEDKAKIEGLAIFKHNKMVGKISDERLYLFVLLNKDMQKGHFAIQLPAMGADLSLSHIKTKKNISIGGTSDAPTVTFNIKMKGVINEYYGKAGGIEKKSEKLEEQINKQLEKKGEKMLKEFQEMGTDPIGIGKKAKAHFRKWDEKKWKEQYPNIDIKVNVKTNVIESGIIN